MLLALALLACSADESDKSRGGADSTSGVDTTDSGAPTGDTVVDERVDAMADSVSFAALEPHLLAWQRIADDNGGNRAAGTDGYAASVDYAAGVLEAAGYAVERYPFDLTWIEVRSSELEVGGEAIEDYSVMYGSGAGDITAPLTGVDLLLPPSDEVDSTSGCEPEDFDGFPAGNIALIQRGTCFFIDKVDNAVSAGASAVILFNEGNSGRTETLEGVIDSERLADIPVLGVSFTSGEAWATEDPGEVHVAVDTERITQDSWNVFAETTGGSSDHVVLLGGHLDSVPAGPGVNDDGSGAAFVLAFAEAAAASGLAGSVRFGFALWGAEELGLIGSSIWVSDMAATDPAKLDRIDAYLNFDMLASPNGVPFVYDGNNDAGFALFPPVSSPPGSGPIEKSFERALQRDGVEAVPVSAGVPSDSLPFQEVGVPTGGLFSGASNNKTSSEADEWGGDAGVEYDVCYHQECDGMANLDVRLYEALARAGAAVATELALDAAPAGPPADRADWRTGPRDEALPRKHDHGPGRHCGGEALPHR
ncbi:MAG: Zn-dependent M28 family amino/carboxypeptidase [Myxococcota bacterium]